MRRTLTSWSDGLLYANWHLEGKRFSSLCNSSSGSFIFLHSCRLPGAFSVSLESCFVWMRSLGVKTWKTCLALAYWPFPLRTQIIVQVPGLRMPPLSLVMSIREHGLGHLDELLNLPPVEPPEDSNFLLMARQN